MRTLLRNAALLASLLLFNAAALLAQTGSVSGVVTDDVGPVIGATVVLDGTTNGTTTDLDGKYTISGLKAGQYTLKYSFVGMEDQRQKVTVTAGKTTKLDIRLKTKAEVLNEMVVVGYGVQRKREVTGSIAKVEPKEITDLPTPSFESALQGKAAGVQVTTGSGMAGSGAVIRVRGIASISAGGDPLYVVDGIPITQDQFLTNNSGGFNNNPLASLNPNDIESIEILKDASATGIYGSRGANGVVLITTKRAKQQGTKFEFTSRVGLSGPTARPNMVDGPTYLQLRQEAWENDGNVGLAPLPGGITWEEALNTNTDWVDQTIGTGVKQMYSFGVKRGTKRLKAYVNATYDDNQSYLIGNGYERISGRANLDYTFSDKLKGGLSLSKSRGTNSRVDNAWSGGLGAAMSSALPIYPVTDSTGEWWNDGTNPVFQRNSKVWKTIENRTINTGYLTYEPVKNLFFKASGGYDYMDLSDLIYEPQEVLRSDHQGQLKRNSTWINNWNYSVTGNYNYELSNDRQLKFMVGHEYQRSTTAGKDRTFTDVLDYTATTAGDSGSVIVTNRATVRYAFMSFFGRANYVHKQKYFFQATLRSDGSSKFGPNNRFGWFPSISAGWVMSEEDWLKESKTISFLKVRASWGIVGNANIPDNLWQGRFSPSGNQAPYNGDPTIFPINNENPNLKWETSNVFDGGVELGLWEDRITITPEAYFKQSKDVLMKLTVPRYNGFEDFWDNVGQINNTGVELAIKSVNIDKKNFKWTTSVNAARNWNKIVSIGGYSEDAVSGGTNDTRVVVGAPVGTNFLVRFSHVDPNNGRPVYIDKDGNTTYTWDPADRVAVGDVLPDVIGGMTNTFNYKNWEMTLVIIGSYGADIYDSSSKRQLGVVSNDWNMRTDIYDRWRQPGDQATYPRLTMDTETYGSTTPWINTDQWLHDGSYLRFRNLTIGYNVPRERLERWKIDNLRVSANLTNFITITKYPGLDPEIARDFEDNADRNMSPNITYLTPPQERTLNFSINLGF